MFVYRMPPHFERYKDTKKMVWRHNFYDVPIENGGIIREWVSSQNNVCRNYVFDI